MRLTNKYNNNNIISDKGSVKDRVNRRRVEQNKKNGIEKSFSTRALKYLPSFYC